MNINVNNQLSPDYTKKDYAKKHQTNTEKRSDAIQKQDAVKKMIQTASNTSGSDQVHLGTAKTQELANAQLEQKTAMMQSDVSSSSSVASKVSVKQRELLQAIAEGDYAKIKRLATEIKSLVQELKASSMETASKYSDVQIPEIPNNAEIQSQDTTATDKAEESAQAVESLQAQVAQGADALKGNTTAIDPESQAKQQAETAIQASNVAKLAELKTTAQTDKATSLKTKEALKKADSQKATAISEKASKLAENQTTNPQATNPSNSKEEPTNPTIPTTGNNAPTQGPSTQDSATRPTPFIHNHAQHQASNAYSKTQQNQKQDNTRVSTQEIKAHPEKYASSSVVKKYVEELKTAQSLGGASMDNYFDITEKVLAKADKAIELAKKIGATDGSAESNSRLADAISDSGIIGAGDVPQSVLTEHKNLSQQHKLGQQKLEQTQKDLSSNNKDQDQSNKSQN